MGEETKKHQDHLQFFKSLEQVNQAIQGASDLQQMMSGVLDAVLSILDCDRAFLLYPCDPDASSWHVPMERTKAEFPGVHAESIEISMTEEVAKTLRLLLDTNGPVDFGPETDNKLPPDVAEQFNIKSYIGMAIYPRVGKPWQLGLHQCSHPRIWTVNDKELFEVVGHRIADGLSVLLTYKELLENRTFLDNIFENIPNMVFVKDAQELRFIRFNKAGEKLVGYSQQELLGKNDYDFFTKEEADFFTAKDREVLDRKELVDIPEETIHTKYGERILHTKKIPLYDKTGKPAYLLGISEDITEQKQMYEAVQSSEERLQLAAEAAQMGLWDWNIITGDVIWSDQCKAHYGFSPETSMSYELFLQALHPDDRDRVDAALKRAVKERTNYNVTKRSIWPDGSIHWTNSRAKVHCDSSGKPVRMVGVTFDITGHKQMEQALILREREFRTLAENSPDNIARYDSNCRTIYVNPTLEKTLGRPASDLLGFTPMERASISEFREYQEKIDEVLQTGKEAEMDTIMPDRGEGLRYHNIRFVAEHGTDGVITGVLAIGRDVTERRQVEEKLRNLSHAIEQSPVSIVITDVNGRIEFVNSTFTQITGYTYAEALGQHTRILKSGETPVEVYRQLWKTISSGGIWRGEFHNRKKNGELFWEYATIAPVKNTDNVISHYVAVKEDITERKKLEEQLHQSQKLEAVGQLAGGVAHDFNNMLGVIIGNVELAMDNENLDDSLRNHLKEILEASFRSTEITRQLLAFAREQKISPKILDLNSTLEGMLKLIRRLIGEDIDLVWLPGSNLWHVKMDPSQVDQILINLCVNARDAIGGVGKVTIETKKVVFDKAYCAENNGFVPGEYVKLAVSDNGRGMDKQTTSKIFEPFFTTKGVGKGTGLGLATVYGIVRQNDGLINVYSEPGHGTTFKIYLPRHEVEIEQVPQASSEQKNLRGHETVLIVEDEHLCLKMMKTVLERYGYRVLTASSPSEALLVVKEHSGIDLLLSDVIMPDMNGPDLAKKVISLVPDIICIFMSGYTGKAIAQHGILDEGFDFIQKPFSTHELAAKVREVLDSK